MTAVGAIGWVVAVIFGVLTLGAVKLFSFGFVLLLFASLPVVIVWEIARWIRGKKEDNGFDDISREDGI